MSALLVKDAPEKLHQWLKCEASFNRRSLNQQVLICLEWCMQTYGEAQPRNPFMPAHSTINAARIYPHGRELAAHLMKVEPLDDESASQMNNATASIRKLKGREFDYACFD